MTIAFPRSPTVMALNAWTLQKLSRGRFTLGLGTQVRGHMQRRYGVPWSPPGPWMREYVHAVRAVWDRWQNGTPLDVRGEFSIAVRDERDTRTLRELAERLQAADDAGARAAVTG